MLLGLFWFTLAIFFMFHIAMVWVPLLVLSFGLSCMLWLCTLVSLAPFHAWFQCLQYMLHVHICPLLSALESCPLMPSVCMCFCPSFLSTLATDLGMFKSCPLWFKSIFACCCMLVLHVVTCLLHFACCCMPCTFTCLGSMPIAYSMHYMILLHTCCMLELFASCLLVCIALCVHPLPLVQAW